MSDKKPIAILAQRYGIWKAQELALFEDEVKVCYRSGPNVSRRTVPLEVFDTNESEGRISSDGLRRAVGFCASGALVFFAVAAAAWIERGALLAWPLWIGGGFGTLAALLGAAYLALAHDAIYFYDAYSGDFLCAIVTDKPDRASAGDFFLKLKAQAKKQSERVKGEAEAPSIARELKSLHDLREKKVITTEEFEIKKDELIEEVLRE